MEIRGTSGMTGSQRIEARGGVAQRGRVGETAAASDRVLVSERARLLDMLSRVPAIRSERVEELRREIEAGTFETPERIQGAVEKLLEELG